TRRRAVKQLTIRAHSDKADGAPLRQRVMALLRDETQPQITRAAAIRIAAGLADKSALETLYQILAEPNADLVRFAAEAIGDMPPAEREELGTAAEHVERALGLATNPATERSLRLALAKLAAAGVEDAAEWGFESMSVTHSAKTPREVFDGHVRALEMVPGAA